MVEEKLLDHVISWLEPQLFDNVEVRHPQTTSSLLKIIDKYEERKIGGIPELTTDILTIAGRRGNPTKFGGQSVGDNRRFDSRRQSGQSDHRFSNQGGRQGGSRNGAFRGQNGQDRISSLRMTSVDLPYVPILLNETFITALCDTGAEKSFISEEVYRRNFSYRPRQKTKDRVVTTQGAPCCHLGRVELQIRIRDFQKTWEFHILDNMQYECILGIDFMKDSKLTLDFDKKSLFIPDDQIKQLPIVEKPVEIDLSDTKLGEGQKQKLQDLFNNFKVLFSDQPGLTHVSYHEIDTGDQGPVVSRPYRYYRNKQGITDYHIEKMLQEGKIRPIQSPYASPVVLTRKNNGLPPDSPEAIDDLLGPYPAFQPERYRFILVITDHFTKWNELIPLRKASAQAIAKALFENYISRYEAPISLISDNGPQFMTHTFEHLSHRLDIKHIKTKKITITGTDSSMSFALRTAVIETTGKTPAELFLGRNIITPFSKLKSACTATAAKKRRNPSSISSRTRKYIRNNSNKHPSQGPETLPDTSNQQQMRRFSSPKEERRRGARVLSDRARETRTTGSKGHSAAEGRPVWSGKTTTVRPCPYYLRSRFKEPGQPEEQRSTGIDSLP
ncbi:uncharacterized protein TNCV_5090051 [Trichonephila clavipes]|nr:uncharacterized protein TNCV_5090051 [Trichonephila clavipes]